MVRLIVALLAAFVVTFGLSAPTSAQEGECAGLSAGDAQALLDGDPTYATRARLDSDNDGVACNEPSRGGAGRTTAPARECAELSAGDAQALLDGDPTYATRARLDSDNDGVACNEPSRGGAGRTTALPNTGIGETTGGKTTAWVLVAGFAALCGVISRRSYRRA